MADIIVQPKVLNADGVTYDNLIMQQSVYSKGKLLWSNNTPANSADLSSFNLSAGDMLRIEYVEVREESSVIVGSRFKDIRLRPANQYGNLYEGAERIITSFANMKLYLFSMNIAFEKGGTLFFNYGGDPFTIIDISNGTSTSANTPYLGMVNIWKINET